MAYSSSLSLGLMERIQNDLETDYDFEKEFELFEETKVGVKGIVDLGITKIPRIFHHPLKCLVDLQPSSGIFHHQPQVPVIDLSQLKDGGEIPMEVVDRVREAAETWGVFQIINHGMPSSTIEEFLHAIRRFHEQPADEKKQWYSTDGTQRAKFYSNLLAKESGFADWRDSLVFEYYDGTIDSETLPLVCRKEVSRYMEQVKRVKEKLCQVFSKALGLSSDYLLGIECMETMRLACHYYPPCPEPELTFGSPRHSDPSFATILLQDDIGGLQVFYKDQWVHVQPIQGALIVNLGDLMQLITNDLFKSVEHRVLASERGPRISAPCFLFPSTKTMSKPYGPLQHLVANDRTENKVDTYKEISAGDYLKLFRNRGECGYSALPEFRISGK